jgi:hypothetical protein
VSHLEPCPPKAALDVETLVGLAAVEDALVAARLLGDEVERLDDAQPQLLALLVLRDGDVLDVPDRAQVVNAVPRKVGSASRSRANAKQAQLETTKCIQLALDNQGASANNLARGCVLNDENKVAAVLLRNPTVPLLELVLCDLANRSQDAQTVEEARIVVGRSQRAQLVALGEHSLHLGREQLGTE